MRVANDSVVMSLAWRPLSHMILREPSVSWSIQPFLLLGVPAGPFSVVMRVLLQ